MNEKIQQQNIPQDLAFIRDFDIAQARKIIEKKFEQTFPASEFQLSLKDKKFTGKVREYIREYGIEEKNLFTIYEKLESQARESGIEIEYTDLSGFSEDDFYENIFDDEDHEKHAETARSDGKVLLLEKDIERAGSIVGRMYDLLHLAYGHMVQWSTTDNNALLTKEEAWAIGYRNHEGSPDKILDLMALYELEAGMMGVNALMRALADIDGISKVEKDAIIQYFTDYVYADSKYIIQHYRGNREKFEKYFTAGNDVPPLYKEYDVPEYIKRQTVEIGLIRDKQ